ncbi:ANTAR domain-containing protein [Lachnospiraceae bacterium 50-23]|jgi:AmiR/NasT family two-component response regulator|nr:ANTAR domain-containing protein [Dorea sp.]GFI37428.1 putative transcriptional regulatory protein pdtaR [Lachnospiraceae bacterium]
MSLRERFYSILLVSATDSFTFAFADLLPETRYCPIHNVTSINAAKRTLSEKTFDFVIINAPLPDDVGIRFSIDTCTTKQAAVLLLVKNDVHADIHDKVAEYGVFTLPKPTSKPTMLHALNWMESARERLRQFEKKSLSIEEKMAEIRLINKAKWILISELQMSEPDAHHYIEKQAMDRCIVKRTIAEEIIKTYT